MLSGKKATGLLVTLGLLAPSYVIGQDTFNCPNPTLLCMGPGTAGPGPLLPPNPIIAPTPTLEFGMQVLSCPTPTLSCVGPGPSTGDPIPPLPPGPELIPIVPVFNEAVDFNNSYAIVENSQVVLVPGTPSLNAKVTEFLELHRSDIEPNAAYLISPDALVGEQAEFEFMIIGGGALSQ